MPPKKFCLTNLPPALMKKILADLELKQFLILRKVCHALRDFIDDINPPSQIYGIDVNIDVQKISVTLNFSEIPLDYKWDEKMYRISYEKQGNGCLMTPHTRSWPEEKPKFLKNSDFLEIFANDFETLLKLQKTQLRFLNIVFRYPNDKEQRDTYKVLDKFKGAELKATSLHVAFQVEHEVLEVLPCLDPNCLKMLKIEIGHNLGRLELYEIMYLEQWEKAKEVVLIGCFAHPQYFLDFEKVEISIQVINSEDIFELKETMSQSSTLAKIRINFQHYYTEQDLVQRFGRFSSENGEFNYVRVDWKTWFLSIPEDKDQVIKMDLYKDSIRMEKMKIEDLPRNAIIAD